MEPQIPLLLQFIPTCQSLPVPANWGADFSWAIVCLWGSLFVRVLCPFSASLSLTHFWRFCQMSPKSTYLPRVSLAWLAAMGSHTLSGHSVTLLLSSTENMELRLGQTCCEQQISKVGLYMTSRMHISNFFYNSSANSVTAVCLCGFGSGPFQSMHA